MTLADAAGIRVFSEPKQGAYAARNRGLLAATGDIIAFTDSDCLPDSGWLQAIDRRLADPRIQVVLGSRRPRRDAGPLRLISDFEDMQAKLTIGVNSADVQYGYTNNMAVRRSTLDRYGPFVERLRGSDTVLLRGIVDGEGVQSAAYEQQMRVIHAEVASVGMYFRKAFIYGRSFSRYSQLVVARPLSRRERWRVFREATVAGHYSLGSAAVLAVLLVGGGVNWSLGRMAAWNS